VMNTFRLQSDSSMDFTLSGIEEFSDLSYRVPVAELVEASRACAMVKAEQKP
jgi:hypothetical protein